MGLTTRIYTTELVRVDLNEECFLVFFQYFPEISVFPIIGKKHEIPKFRENAEKTLKKTVLVKIDPKPQTD